MRASRAKQNRSPAAGLRHDVSPPLFVLDNNQSPEILTVQLAHHFRDSCDSTPQQYVHFSAGGLSIFQMDYPEARRELSHRLHRIVAYRE